MRNYKKLTKPILLRKWRWYAHTCVCVFQPVCADGLFQPADQVAFAAWCLAVAAWCDVAVAAWWFWWLLQPGLLQPGGRCSLIVANVTAASSAKDFISELIAVFVIENCEF